MGKVYNSHWKPVCVPSRDHLIYNIHTIKESLVGFGLVDTMRFSEKLPNGKNVSESTDEELVEALEWYCEPVRYFNVESHVENFDDDDRPMFEIKCPDCNFVEIFEELRNIPHENHRCPCCGKYLIEYYGDDTYDDVDMVDYLHGRMYKAFNTILEKYNADKV